MPKLHLEDYPIPLHELYSNQWSLVSPIGPAASMTWRFGRGKVFASDYCYMLQDIGAWDPNYFEAGMPWIASYAALEANDTNESRGYLHPPHEVHRIKVGPLYAGAAAVDQTRDLGRKWDARGAEYYDTVANPIGIEYYGRRDLHHLVIRSIVEYLEYHGQRAWDFVTKEWILHHQARTNVPIEDLEVGTEKFHLIDFLVANIKLILDQVIEAGMLAVWQRTNPDGHKVKEMRDGEFSLAWPDDTLVNFRDPVGTFELAAGDYTALMMFTYFFEKHHPEMYPELTRQAYEVAEQLRRKTLDLFLINATDDLGPYFAMAIQKDVNNPDGPWQQVPTRGSGPFEAWDGLFMQSLPEEEYRYYTAPMVRQVYSRDRFLTLAGVRCVDQQLSAARGFSDYQWSDAVWTTITGRIAAGLEQHGMWRLAQDLRYRSTNAAALGGKVREFYIVPGDQEPYYLYSPLADRTADSPPGDVVIAPNDPEGGQGFSNSVILCGALTEFFPKHGRLTYPTPFQQQLVQEARQLGGWVEVLTAEMAEAHRFGLPVCYVDMEEAEKRLTEIREKNAHLINPIRRAS